jgi:glucose-1-phosphate cytidylyltransferase
MVCKGELLKVYILAGGFGTRFAEMTDRIPKPMISIGKFPILLHIMSHYSSHGMTDFTVLAGYKAAVIEEYFSRGEGRDITSRNLWNVRVSDTGEGATTAGRLYQVRDELPESFMLTYGDGLSDVNLKSLRDFHESSSALATVTAVRPPARFGTIEFDSGFVTSFREKDPQRTGWINGGFFCLSRDVVTSHLDPDFSLESHTMENLVKVRQLAVFPHEGFWHPMDTLRDQRSLSSLLLSNTSPWNTAALE